MRNAQWMRVIGLMWGCVLTASASNAADLVLSDSQLDVFEELLNEHPDSFAGLTVDPERHRVIIRRVGAYDAKRMRSFLEKAKQSPAVEGDRTWSLTTVPVTRSHRKLNAVRERLLTEEPFASLLRPVLAIHHIDRERNVVAVGVTAISDELFGESKRTFGDAVELYITERLQPLSRTNWVATGSLAGGTFLQAPGGKCTSGFSVRPTDGSSIRGFITAGHCFVLTQFLAPISDGVGNYIAPSYVWNFGEFFTDGLSSSTVPWTLGTDAALVVDRLPGQTFVASPEVYTTNTARLPVVGTASPREGDIVCFSGAFTGENCKVRIVFTGAKAILTVPKDFFSVSSEITDLVITESTDGSFTSQPGDSGGPVYIKTTFFGIPAVRAMGIINSGIPAKPGDPPGPTKFSQFQPISKVMPRGWRLQ